MGCSASVPREGSVKPSDERDTPLSNKGKTDKGVSLYAQWYIEPADAPDDSFSDLIAPTQRDAAATRRASIEFRNRPANVRPEVTRKGLTLRGLRRLRKHIEQLVTDGWFKESLVLKNETFPGVTRFEDLTTTQLVYQWIKHASVSGRERLADVTELVPPEDVAMPSYFISHAWKGRVHKLFDTIESFLHNAADTTAVWIDAVAINQHNDTNREQNLADVGAFEDVVCVCEAGTLVVVDVKRCNPASRAWCVYEWHHTLAFHGPDGLHMHGMTAEQRSEIINNIDVAKASCEYESDHAMIKHNIICHHGSLAAFDTALKLQLLLEPLSYKVDLDQLGRRSVGTRWKFQQVKQWMDRPKGGRALCVLGEPGTGKSSISAAFCQQLLQQREEEPGMWRGPISAVHFLKHSDQRRLDPVNVIKSLTYQIASRLPAAAAAVLNNDAKTVAELRDVDVAFALLLAPALACTREPVFLLIDAIDEGDPPEQQRPDFKGSIMACANKALVLILQHLAPKLPTNVRFLLSSRPDAVGGGIQDILRRRFPDVVFLEPRHVREDGELPPGQTGRVLMTEAIIREYQTQGFELVVNRSATCGGLEELYSTYAAVFKLPPAKRPSSDAAAERTIAGVKLLLQVLMAAQEPMSHSALQQMGMADFLNEIPGWGVLFYMADHHVYMIHKSISDWLRDPSRSGQYAVDVQAGHRFLGLHFIKEVLKPSFTATSVLPAYTAKYAIRHLCLAGPEVAPLLDVALGQWDFLRKIFEAGQGGRLLQALNIPSERSPYCEDTVRWLGRYMSEFEHKPSEMEAVTMQPDTRVPRSFKCQEAATRLGARIETMVLGGTGSDWSADSCTLKGHSDSITSVAFSPDGKQLATGSADHNARIWDLSSGHCSVILQEHTDVVSSVAFSPDGKLLATGSWDNTAKLWDLSSGQCINTLKGHDDFVFSEDSYTVSPIQGITGISVAFSFDGKQLATGGDDCTSRIWDVHSGQCKMTLRGHTGPIASVAFCPVDSKVLATGSWDKTIKIWELTSLGRCKTTLKGHCNPVSCVVFSPCGEKLASGSGAQQVRQKREDKSARIWELSSGHCLMTLAHNDFVASVAFSADGEYVATGSNDETTKVWKVSTGQCTMTLEGHRNPITNVAFSPNTKHLQLATGSTDKTAKIWDLTSEQCSITPEGHRGAVSSVTFDAAGTLLATGSFDGIARTWDLSTGQCRVMLKWPYVPWGHNFMAFDVAFTPDGSRLAVGYSDWTAKVWDLASGSCSYTLEGHTGPVFAVAVSPDGRWLATGSDDTTAKVWDLESRACVKTLEGHTDYISSVAFSPDGHLLATGAGDCAARIWDLSSGKCVRVIKDAHRDPVSSVAFAPNGQRLATGSYDRTAKLWSMTDGRCTGTFGKEPMERIAADTAVPLPLQGLPGTSITFSPDGRHIAIGGQDGAKLCDLKTSNCSAMLQGHSEAVSSVAFSRDGKLATGSRDRSAKIWEHVTEGSRSVTPPEGSARRTSISFSPDGRQLQVGLLGISTSDLVIEVCWDLSNGERIRTEAMPHSHTCAF